jgi:hypothetical protein
MDELVGYIQVYKHSMSLPLLPLFFPQNSHCLRILQVLSVSVLIHLIQS